MVAEVYAGISAFKTAFDIAKGLKDIDDATRRNSAVIELQEHILGAQAAQTALIEDVNNLKKQIAEFETWEREKKRYKLEETGYGGFAYSLKEEESEGEPPHKICAGCYQHSRKRILMYGATAKNQAALKCFECGLEVRIKSPEMRISQEAINASSQRPARKPWIDRG